MFIALSPLGFDFQPLADVLKINYGVGFVKRFLQVFLMKVKKVFCTILCSILAACGGNDSPAGYSAQTPKGVTVRSASAIQPDVLVIIDRQLDDLFRIAAAKGYTGFARHPNYGIRLVPRDPRCDAISFLIIRPGTNYDGSEYDKDPRPGFVSLCAAGRFTPEDGMIHVTAEGVATSQIVRYEGEHKLLYQVNGLLYEQTKVHGQGQGHPILGD